MHRYGKFTMDYFVMAIAAVILLAYFLPPVQKVAGLIDMHTAGRIGVSMIFFFYGLKLSPEKLKKGLGHFRLHVLIQLSTFLIFPLLVLTSYPMIQNDHQKQYWLAFMFLASLPSTVSSSVVMVSIARGNLPAAIFNASISGLIGIIITPLWMGMFLDPVVDDFDFNVIYLKLLKEILLPVMAGLVLQKYFGKYAIQYSKWLTLFDKSVILLIIYTSFSDSFRNHVFRGVRLSEMLVVLCLSVVLFFIMYFATGYLSKIIRLNPEDRITAQFCGTKKSLVHGTVFTSILFPASYSTGIILLPLMLFHVFQILYISMVANRLGQIRVPEPNSHFP